MAVKRKKEGVEGTSFNTYLELVTLSDGMEIELPRLTTGKMSQISKSLSKLIDAITERSPEGMFDNWKESQRGDNTSDLGMDIIKILPQIFPLVFDEIIILMSDYLDEPETWVRELPIEDLTSIFTPFLRSTLVNLNHLLSMIGLGQMINIQGGEAATQEENPTLVLVQDEPTQ